jgi:hypothetical protein
MMVLISIRSLDDLSVLGLNKVHVSIVKFAITLCFWSAILGLSSFADVFQKLWPFTPFPCEVDYYSLCFLFVVHSHGSPM